MWTDRSFFQNTVNLVFGSLADKVPPDFIADREKLRGAKFDVAAMASAIPQMRDQFRAHVQWIESQLADGRIWIGGDKAGLCDVNAYMNIWYVRAHLANADEVLAEFACTRAWETRIRAVGHGRRSQRNIDRPRRSTSQPTPRRRPPSCPTPAIPTAASPATGSR